VPGEVQASFGFRPLMILYAISLGDRSDSLLENLSSARSDVAKISTAPVIVVINSCIKSTEL